MAKVKIASKEVLRGTDGRPFGVRINFTDGGKVEVVFADLTDDMTLEVIAHGLGSKLGDSYAGENSPTVARGLCEAVADSILGGNWNRRGTGDSADLTTALVNLTGESDEAVRAMLADKDKDERKAIAGDAWVKAEMARIKADRLKAQAGTSPIDLGSLFGGAEG